MTPVFRYGGMTASIYHGRVGVATREPVKGEGAEIGTSGDSDSGSKLPSHRHKA